MVTQVTKNDLADEIKEGRMAELTEDAVPVREVPEHRVNVDMSFTKNLGNFESLKVNVGLALTGRPDETPDQTYAKVADWVEARLIERFKSVSKELQ